MKPSGGAETLRLEAGSSLRYPSVKRRKKTGKTSPERARSAPTSRRSTGAVVPEILFFAVICGSSAMWWAYIPDNCCGGCGVLISLAGSVGGSCSTRAVVARRVCLGSVHKSEAGPAEAIDTRNKKGLRWAPRKRPPEKAPTLEACRRVRAGWPGLPISLR